MVVIARKSEVSSDLLRVPYFRAQYYDPSVGQFTTMDPFAGDTNAPQSLHKYAYVHGDPVNSIDPSGLFGVASVAIGIGIGGLLGGLTGGAFGALWGDSPDDIWEGFWKGALIGAVGGGTLPLAAAGAGWTAGAIGLRGAALANFEFFAGAGISGAATGGLEAWLNQGDILQGALIGGAVGPIFGGAMAGLGSVARNVRLPTTAVQSDALSRMINRLEWIASSDRFIRAAGLGSDSVAMKKFQEYIRAASYGWSRAGGSVQLLDDGLQIGLGSMSERAITHELIHIARAAKHFSQYGVDILEQEARTKKYDPVYWALWLKEETATWLSTITY